MSRGKVSSGGAGEAVAHLRRVDPLLASWITRVGQCTLRPSVRRTPFQALVRSVVYQQLAGSVAEKILGRVLACFPGTPFPTAEQLRDIPEETLRAAGLSRAKTAALKDIAARVLDGTVPDTRSIRRLGDDEIVERLTVIRGVGPWTVQMFLIFTLGRPDVLPASDYGVRQGFARAYGRPELPSSQELLEYGERWRPHRTTAAWYLWRVLDLPD